MGKKSFFAFPNLSFGNIYCKTVPKNGEISGLTLNVKISHSVLIYSGFSSCGSSEEPITLNLFEPIGIILATVNGESSVSYSDIQVYPAFALKFWADLTAKNKQKAAADIITNTALLALGVAEVRAVEGVWRALAFIQTVGSAGDVAFSAWDGQAGGWETEKYYQDFRDAWHGITALASTPSIIKAVAIKGPELAIKIINSSKKAGTQINEAGVRIVLELKRIFNIIDDPEYWVARIGRYVDPARAHNLAKQIVAELGTSIAIKGSDISDDFLKFFAYLPEDESRKLVMATFFNDKQKFFAFQSELKIEIFLEEIKNNIDLIKMWENIYLARNLDNWGGMSEATINLKLEALKALGRNATRNKDVCFAFNETIGEFGVKTNSHPWFHWPEVFGFDEDIINDPLVYKQQFDGLTDLLLDNGSKFHFNLAGIINNPSFIAEINNGVSSASKTTVWEVAKIVRNKNWFSNTIFYNNGRVVKLSELFQAGIRPIN